MGKGHPGPLALDNDGNVYGTTSSGGTLVPIKTKAMGFGGFGGGPDTSRQATGTVFKIDSATNALTTVATFEDWNGWFPEGITRDRNGTLYGVTAFGAMGMATLYKIAVGANTISTLATFDGMTSMGGVSAPGVTLDRKGNLYGVLATSDVSPFGMVFILKKGTTTPVPFAQFTGGNGGYPAGCLAMDSQGNLYGTTHNGGSHESGTVFKIEAGTNRIVTLVAFDGTNGSSPETGVIIDSRGNLYGTTRYGSHGKGMVFKIAAGTSTVTTLVVFNGANGAFPETGLTIDRKGTLYGTTREGGPNDKGTVFTLTPSSAP